jgi:hypothetical protein
MIIPSFFRLPVFGGLMLLGAVAGRAQFNQTWLMLNQSTQDTLMVTDPAEHTKFQKDRWMTNGTGNLRQTATPDTMGVHRMLRLGEKGGARMFTINPAEVAACLKTGYREEGVLGFAAATQLKPEMIPVYRFTKEGRHIWLIGVNARPWAEKNGWKSEGVGFWIWPAEGR